MGLPQITGLILVIITSILTIADVTTNAKNEKILQDNLKIKKILEERENDLE